MTATNLTRRTMLVDGNNLLMRAYHAARNSHSQMNAGGVPTAALHIVVSMLSRYVRTEDPDHLVVCWDGGKSTHRLALLPEYKGQRRDAPDEDPADRPFAQTKEFLTLAGVHHVEHPGYEADDLIAAYWRRKSSTERVTILSSDKDFLQLLDGWTEQVRPGTGDEERWTSGRVRSDMGCKPEHLPFVMALTGDSGDDVPGIPGFGTKTAVKALQAVDWDLERLLADPPLRLVGKADIVRRNLALVDLRSPLPGLSVGEIPRFRPTEVISVAYPLLDQFLLRYGLETIRSRVALGLLWRDAENRP